MDASDRRNMFLAIALSIAILVGFELLYTKPRLEQQAEQAQQQATQQQLEPSTPTMPGPTIPGSPAEPATQARDAVLEGSPRVSIATGALRGSISLDGGRLDDLVLTRYRETLDPGSPEINLLHPVGTENAYYVDFGWAAADRGLSLPNAQTRWESEGARLAPGEPVTLSWDNGQGLRFERVFDIDDDYLFTVTQRVVNQTDQPITLSPYGLVSRRGTPDVLGFYILHEGLIGVLGGTLEEIDYSDLRDEARNGFAKQDFASTGGWMGITDKYWLVSLIPGKDEPVEGRFLYDGKSGADKYQVDYLGSAVTIPAGGESVVTSRLFAGAKVVDIIDRYAEAYGIEMFDRAIDFGWFYFLTKPLFSLLNYIYKAVGNFGIAILVLTVIIKIVFFPLANKSYRSMAKMRKLQPQVTKLREIYGDDRQRLSQEMMELYKREQVNPMSGCLPMLIQIPVFFALYKVLFVTIEMRHAPFYGWIKDLSAPDPTTIFNGFGLLPWTVPDLGLLNLLSIGIWPIAMGVTMFVQTKLNPQPADPVQAKIFLWMPIFFTFLLAQFPAGLVIYWTWNNVLSIIQQVIIMKRAGVPIGGGSADSDSSSDTSGSGGSGSGGSGGGNGGGGNSGGDGGDSEESTGHKRRKNKGRKSRKVAAGEAARHDQGGSSPN